MDERERVRSVGKVVAPWLLEGIFIVISVLLGFAAAQYGEDRDNKELAHRALSSLQTELEFNLAVVGPTLHSIVRMSMHSTKSMSR